MSRGLSHRIASLVTFNDSDRCKTGDQLHPKYAEALISVDGMKIDEFPVLITCKKKEEIAENTSETDQTIIIKDNRILCFAIGCCHI